MICLSVSIFEDDSPNKDYKLYSKYMNKEEINFHKHVVYEGKLSVRKKSGSFMSRFYQIIDKKLVYYLNNVDLLFYSFIIKINFILFREITKFH